MGQTNMIHRTPWLKYTFFVLCKNGTYQQSTVLSSFFPLYSPWASAFWAKGLKSAVRSAWKKPRHIDLVPRNGGMDRMGRPVSVIRGSNRWMG